MKNEECGQVTIFLSLLLISFLLILSVCLEGIYLHIQKGRIAQQQAAAGECAQANYHKELLEQYHIFAIDGRYGAKMEASLKRNWTYHTGNAPSVLHISNEVDVTESDGQILRHQIREYMKYAESAKLLDQIKDSLSGVKEEAETDSIKDQVEHIKEEDSDQEVQVEEQPVQDPRKGLKKLLSEGLLPLVLPEGKNISEQAVNIVYGKKDGTKEKKIDFFRKDSVAEYLSTNGKKTAGKNLATEGLAAAYAAEVFQDAVGQRYKDGVQYEMEYLIAGKATDTENLKSVVHRLMAIRFGLNYAYLLSDGGKQAQAYALAVQIGTIASAVPAVVEGIKMLIMAAWAYGEAVIDLRGLLKGNKIPLIKKEENWQLSLHNLAKLSAETKSDQSGISYQDYLKILLLLQSDQKEKYMRMMDLMEQRIQIKQPDFVLQECYFSYQMTVESKIRSLFFKNTYIVKDTRNYVY